jgi:hypothetical protein
MFSVGNKTSQTSLSLEAPFMTNVLLSASAGIVHPSENVFTVTLIKVALLQDVLQKLGKETRHLNLEIKIEMSELRFFEQFFRSR